MGDAAPLTRLVEVTVAAASAGSGQTAVIDAVPFDGTVTAVTFIPVSTITGANSNYRTVTVKNAAQDGTGTTTVATAAFTSGVNAAAGDETTIALSGTAANLVVAAGDVLEWVETVTGSGLAQPGGKVRVTVSRSL